MCGLVGAVTRRNVMPVLLDSLSKLEYRGYDSAGLALIDAREALEVHRCVGRVSDLAEKINGSVGESLLGIGHTRWATHGKPEERNAHPQISRGEVAVVHNGIIENHEMLRRLLSEKGYEFSSETDTEVIAHLVHQYLQDVGDLAEAVRLANLDLRGSYAVAVISSAEPETIIVTRRDNPLVVGVGEGEHFVASDSAALMSVTNRFVFPEDGDIVHLVRDNIKIFDSKGRLAGRQTRIVQNFHGHPSKGPYRHFMLKEIHEQPEALKRTLRGLIHTDWDRMMLCDDPRWMGRISRVQVVACGSSYYAGQVARYWLESLAAVPCTVELASEYRYRSPMAEAGCLFVGMSQSGETADTLAALRHAKGIGYLGTLSICNVAESSMCRESDGILLTRAGPEIGVASTKAFTTQLLSMLALALRLSCRGKKDGAMLWGAAIKRMTPVSRQVATVLNNIMDPLAPLVDKLARSEHALLLGRGPLYPVALEGALKLKETSYIHAEAFAAGELKHGPLALVDERMPVIVLAPHNGWVDKVKANLREVAARGGELYILADRNANVPEDAGTHVIEMPETDELLAPIAYTVALQLLAYHVAVIKGTDVDKPRNLAKSVTVE